VTAIYANTPRATKHRFPDVAVMNALDLETLKTKRLCSECISEDSPFFRLFEEHGKKDKCEYNPEHKGLKTTIRLEQLAEPLHEYLTSNYTWGEEYSIYDDRDRRSTELYGEPLENIVEELLECDGDLQGDLLDLAAEYELIDFASGELSFYGYDSYESMDAAQKRRTLEESEWNSWFAEPTPIWSEWVQFSIQVLHRNRMFKLPELLRPIFEGVEGLSINGIAPIYELPAEQDIYRARVANDEFGQSKWEDNPQQFLWAPPSEITPAGRMNHAFIPVFYGALSEECAVVEIQPYIEQTVVVGHFKPTRPLKVFDFTAFERIFKSKLQEVTSDSKHRIMNTLQEMIARPIAPSQKARDYLPTQFLAEFLREEYGVDAIIYFSSLRARTPENRNIAIFLEDPLLTDLRYADGPIKLYNSVPSLKTIESIDYKIVDYQSPYARFLSS